MKQLLLPVRLQTSWLLVEAHRVTEVLGRLDWLRLPLARREVPGVISWRAKALPVVDLAAFVTATAPLTSEGRARTLVIETGASTIAVPVDAAAEVAVVDAEAIRPQHAATVELATGETEIAGELMAVLDWDRVMDRLITGRDLPEAG